MEGPKRTKAPLKEGGRGDEWNLRERRRKEEQSKEGIQPPPTNVLP
jgi:hypothetical protein